MLAVTQWWDWLRDSIPEDQAWMVLRIVIAGVLGGVVGWERELQKKSAGIRTHILVAVAAGLFSSVTVLVVQAGGRGTDALRTVNAVATGIGFLGAGLIFVDRSHNHVFGLTTAASVWATSAVGLTAGFGYFFLATCATLIIWSVLKLLNWLTPELAHHPLEHMKKASLEDASPGDAGFEDARLEKAGPERERSGNTGSGDEGSQKPGP